MCGSLRSFAQRISLLHAQDSFRVRMERQLLAKLYDLGLLTSTGKLSDVENTLTVAAFCRRRLAVVLCASKMTQTVSAVRNSSHRALARSLVQLLLPSPRPSSLYNKATSGSVQTLLLILHFLLRGADFFLLSDSPTLISPRHMEDFVTWVDASKLKRTVMQYNDEVCHLSFPISLSS